MTLQMQQVGSFPLVSVVGTGQGIVTRLDLSKHFLHLQLVTVVVDVLDAPISILAFDPLFRSPMTIFTSLFEANEAAIKLLRTLTTRLLVYCRLNHRFSTREMCTTVCSDHHGSHDAIGTEDA